MNGMRIRQQCLDCQGAWVKFRTHYGVHQGVIHQVRHDAVLVRVPAQYAPRLASLPKTDDEKLDVALAQWGAGYPRYGAVAPGYGPAAPGYGYNWWWAAGFLWWWLAFAAIFWLAFLFW
ncbi:hypothetical protein [Sulfoacidibacillus thermotolerans]|uniref:Uncharacterized protein n=1 Tax=Sulfoacidibacillus thermotolerans TaxID=1765684 RepID=A0A2U3DAP5_SULT2|nr:hypothetical protein [Sulfoacidibacillus thermotolerans]PWI58358.1 hypothetical protein BM613_03835 [Sulfoacidibacillus thermotolerans]